METSESEQLRTWGSGDAVPDAIRSEGAVVKSGGVWVEPVTSLLEHLRHAGFVGAPKPRRTQATSDFAVSYIEGTSAHPHAWADNDIRRVGELLRGLHDATADFAPPVQAVWKDHWLRGVGNEDRVYGHGDAAPWNIVGKGGRPEALIDWEFAGPIDRLTEVAYASWLNAQLHDDDVAELQELPDAQSRMRQFAMILDGYGLSRGRQGEVVERMIEVAVHAARHEAVLARVTPDSDQAIDDSGYPVLWAVTWRARSASWMLRHRAALARAQVD